MQSATGWQRSDEVLEISASLLQVNETLDLDFPAPPKPSYLPAAIRTQQLFHKMSGYFCDL